MKLALSFRYRVKIKGLENLNSKTLNKAGGVLFLPNHPTVFVDPTLITMAVWLKYPIRPLIVEYMYYTPGIHWMMKFLKALPVPKFALSSNSLKKKRTEKVIETIIDELRHGQNFLIYPAGRLKSINREVIGGASAVQQIISAVPEANVVLVRITGLWGSRFSYALSDEPPVMFGTIFWGIKTCLKNLLFFTPRREVTIELVPAGPDFPYTASRLEMNKYLENWYNRPDELSAKQNPYPGETLKLVSYSMWKEDLPKITKGNEAAEKIDLAAIPTDMQQKIKAKLADMAKMPPEQILPEMSLASDLGLDSLDIAEITAFLADEFDIAGVPVSELTTVGRVMSIAAGQIVCKEVKEEEHFDMSAWTKKVPHTHAVMSKGETIIEVVLNTCDRMGSAAACADSRSGVLTYSQLKMRIVLLAEYIRKLPGDYIGVLLPASVASYVVILACQLAGKIPLPINWTVGPRHLESVVALSGVQTVLSSWSFLDRLDNVDLNGIEDKIVMLEDARRSLSLVDKLKAFFRARKSTKSLLRLFHADTLTKDSRAVLLFTSGTESLPKGVPLTHGNILSNQRAAVESLDLFTDDMLLGILPPFHAFGFAVSGLIPLVVGMRVAYFPNPTDGRALSKETQKWGATILCGAPSFIKAILKAAEPDELTTVRLCVTGAEKAPPELLQLAKEKAPQAQMIEGYGITECSPVLTLNKTGSLQFGVGAPLPGIDLCIVDLETHQPLPQGKQGLILARGPNIFSGYLNVGLTSPFLTVRGQHWYNTGDLGYLDDKGNLILAGRLKRFIKIGAEMISLGALEDALLQIAMKRGSVAEVEGPILAICAKEQAGDKPKIVLVSKFAISVDEVNKSLKESGFSNLVKISQVEQLTDIPLLGSGKVNYRALESRYI